jgi:peptidoglycan biosynthesis protein MviN/MurJ (putative lipid II flippase)
MKRLSESQLRMYYLSNKEIEKNENHVFFISGILIVIAGILAMFYFDFFNENGWGLLTSIIITISGVILFFIKYKRYENVKKEIEVNDFR